MADFLYHEPCPECGSSDNLARYSDGSAHCFSHGCKYWVKPDESYTPSEKIKKGSKKLPPLGDYLPLANRGISAETCAKMRYSVGHYHVRDKAGNWVPKKAHIVYVPDQDGNPVAAKIRMAKKDFRCSGDMNAAGLVFQDVWPAGGRKIIITEGEIDALSVSQAQNNKYPVVSLPNGVDSAVAVCGRSRKYLNSFEEIILMFDQDEPGAAASKAVSKLFGDKAKIAKLPMKDANEMLLDGKSAGIIDAVFRAQPWTPDGVVRLSSLREEMKEAVVMGSPWMYGQLTDATFGRRPGEIYFIGAGVGIGKTDFMLQQMVFDLEQGEGSAAFLLEQPVVESGKRMAGKLAGKLFHLPPEHGNYTDQDLDTAIDQLIALGDPPLYDHWGAKDWETISQNIAWLAETSGTRHFWVDHITALVAQADDEKRAIEQMTEQMASLAQKHRINLYVASHLATPDGKPHEEGGKVAARHFKGSRAIAQWGHFLLGFERDTQSDDEFVRTVTTCRLVKDRYTGQSTGRTFLLGYDRETGRQYELTAEEQERYHSAVKTGGGRQPQHNEDF